MKKPLFIIGIVIAISAVLVFFFKYRDNRESRQFTGNFLSIQNDSILVEGRYLVDHKYEPIDKFINAEVVVDSSTTFKRIALHLPSAKELEGTDGKFEVSKLKTDESTVSFEDFKKDAEGRQGVGIQVFTGENIWGKTKFSAKDITYKIGIYPK